MSEPENDHGRTKYLRTIFSADGNHPSPGIKVDVYCVIKAYAVTCPALQHVIKKTLCAGIRGKGDIEQDLKEARVALDRAIAMLGDGK